MEAERGDGLVKGEGQKQGNGEKLLRRRGLRPVPEIVSYFGFILLRAIYPPTLC